MKRKRSWSAARRVLLALILIPVIGLGIPFGGAFVYGRAYHAVMLHRAESRLEQYRPQLWAIVESGAAVDEELAEMGFESFFSEDGAVLFRFPYDSSRHFQWVPCGLLYAEDVSALPPWRRIEPLQDGWYFFWES